MELAAAAAMYPLAPLTPAPCQAMPYGVEITNRVFVGGCPYTMTELELWEFFSKFGEVKDAKIITDRDGGKSRGYGFVTFATEEQAANVYSKGSVYYEQKKLNLSKAIRKHGGQYQKANQDQRLVWLHPSGYLMTQQENGWLMEQLPSHPPVKPSYYSSLPPPPLQTPAGLYYNPTPYMPAPPLGNTSLYGGNFYGGAPYPTTSPYLDDTVSIINTIGVGDHTSLEDSSYIAPPLPPGQQEALTEGEGKSYCFDMEALEVKTKQLSLDSAYTSEADLDSSHDTIATSSGTTSPKETNSIPSSPKHHRKSPETTTFIREQINSVEGDTVLSPTQEGVTDSHTGGCD